MSLSMLENESNSQVHRTVFVGGPIQHALRGNAMTPDAQRPIQLMHGMVNDLGATLLSAHVAERFGEDTHSFTPSQVAERDYRWMNSCSIFVAILPCDTVGQLIRTDGTHIELGWASAMAKPIVVLAPAHAHSQLSHLVKGLSSVAQVHILDLEAAMADPTHLRSIIKGYLQGEIPKLLNSISEQGGEICALMS